MDPPPTLGRCFQLLPQSSPVSRDPMKWEDFGAAVLAMLGASCTTILAFRVLGDECLL